MCACFLLLVENQTLSFWDWSLGRGRLSPDKSPSPGICLAKRKYQGMETFLPVSTVGFSQRWGKDTNWRFEGVICKIMKHAGFSKFAFWVYKRLYFSKYRNMQFTWHHNFWNSYAALDIRFPWPSMKGHFSCAYGLGEASKASFWESNDNYIRIMVQGGDSLTIIQIGVLKGAFTHQALSTTTENMVTILLIKFPKFPIN